MGCLKIIFITFSPTFIGKQHLAWWYLSWKYHYSKMWRALHLKIVNAEYIKKTNSAINLQYYLSSCVTKSNRRSIQIWFNFYRKTQVQNVTGITFQNFKLFIWQKNYGMGCLWNNFHYFFINIEKKIPSHTMIFELKISQQ